MKPCVRIEPVQLHTDSRGLVLEPLGPEAIPAQRNVHLVLTEPGGVRGNHYHLQGTEVARVLGPALVRVREHGEVRDTQVPEGKAWNPTCVRVVMKNSMREDAPEEEDGK